MSRDGSVILDWAGRPRLFRLAWGQFFRLQERLGCGPYHLAARLSGDGWRIDDIGQTLLWGLVGGGMAVTDAVLLIRSHVETAPPNRHLITARLVIAAGVGAGVEERIEFVERRQKSPPEPELPNGRIRVANIYGNGAAMGWSPDQVDRASIWQMTAAQAGFARANTPDADKTMTSAEIEDIWAGVQDRMQ